MILSYGKISSGKENQQCQENGGEVMQTGVKDYQKRDGVSSGRISRIAVSVLKRWIDKKCSNVKIAVGTAVTSGPPRRSVREELPHTALALSRARKRCSG